MAKNADQIAKASKPDPKPKREPREKREPVNHKAATQEAKDLKTLIHALGDKNSPADSKEITVYAKETLKIVAQAQKSDSAAFKREATKALAGFRAYVEKTEKLNDFRRNQILKQIDSANLDAKSSIVMMKSIAVNQTKKWKADAKRDIALEKIKMKQLEKETIANSQAKAKEIESESKLKTKARKQELEEKFKAIKEERDKRFKTLVDEQNKKNAENKQKLKDQKDALKQSQEKKKQDLAGEKTKLKQLKDAHSQKVAQDRVDLKAQKDKMKQDNEARKLKMKQDNDDRKQKLDAYKQTLEQQKLTNKQANEAAKLQIKQDRSDQVTRLKKLKQDMKDNYDVRMAKGKQEIADRKANNAIRRKAQFDKIRQMQVEHKAKMKQIQEDAKGHALIEKQKVKEALDARKKKMAKHEENSSELAKLVKEGILEANPMLHAALQITKGIAGFIGHKKEQKKLNTLQHNNQPAAQSNTHPNNTPNQPPAAPPQQNQQNAQAGGGGFFSGLLNMVPGVSSILSGIGSFFTTIVGAFSKVGSFLLGGARFLPVVGLVATVIGGIFEFIEGFNNASKLFGEKVSDDDYVKRLYSGFVQVFGSILGIFDTVAGWLGFDTDLQGSFKKKMVGFFDTIVNTFRSLAGSVASVLDKIPGMGGAAKTLKDFSNGGDSKGSITGQNGSASDALKDKTAILNNEMDELDRKKASGKVQVVQDNSVKQQSTTIVQPKMSTRNEDSLLNRIGQAATNAAFAVF